MTNEEAITLLRSTQLMLTTPDGKPISDLYHAIDIAIRSIKICSYLEDKINEDSTS